ncbi:hypothetical protein F511_25357 [Dorcoceras hygrometricum]|uniref:Uncharacterized protein n=1 Tax=Dorcoceras hygrometricum TaxID=472368 RepID=A0A2Z7A2W6_9LAMI|nr:hypothetical protein F511_25357 [Dorcoceras hygrometricum]
MALSLIQNALQINFDSVLSLSNEGMVSMFKAIESSGLRGFLGSSTAVYEKDLVTFFENATVRGNTVVSSVKGVTMNISKEQFAGIFDLPTEGKMSVNDLPTKLINEVRRAFSESGELIKHSCEKKETKEDTEEEDTDSEDTVSLSKMIFLSLTCQLVVFPPTNFTESTAQLRASIDHIQFEKEGLTTLSAQLSEIIAYINRGRDDKKGEDSSSGPQPEDRSRPGGSGSNSEPSKRGGGSYRGIGSRSSGFSRWFY